MNNFITRKVATELLNSNRMAGGGTRTCYLRLAPRWLQNCDRVHNVAQPVASPALRGAASRSGNRSAGSVAGARQQCEPSEGACRKSDARPRPGIHDRRQQHGIYPEQHHAAI